MEENNIELYDYLIAIWKRKILIIVMTLVCIGVGVAMSKPQAYRAEAVIKIGKKVKLVPTSGVMPIVDYIEDPGNFTKIMPHKYGSTIDNDFGYSLKVKQIGKLSMIKLILEGADKGVERALKEIVDMLIDEHTSKAQDSVIVYREFMTKLEIDTEKIQRDITAIEISIREMKASIREKKNAEGDFLSDMPSPTGEENVEDSFMHGGGRSASLMSLLLKTIDKERDLSDSRLNLVKIQWNHYQNKMVLGNLEEYKTELVGKIVTSATKHSNVKISVVVGFIISLFITFFWEYIVESKSRRKGKLQG